MGLTNVKNGIYIHFALIYMSLIDAMVVTIYICLYNLDYSESQTTAYIKS